MQSTLGLRLFFHEGHFCVQLERCAEGSLFIARQVFTTEPTDPELYQWWLQHGHELCSQLNHELGRQHCFTLAVNTSAASPTTLKPFAMEACGGPPSPARSHSLQRRKARRALLLPPIRAEARAAAQANRQQKRQLAEGAARLQRLAKLSEKAEKKKVKRRQKKLGH